MSINDERKQEIYFQTPLYPDLIDVVNDYIIIPAGVLLRRFVSGTSIAFDQTHRRVIQVDPGRHCVRVFSPDGTFVSQYGSYGQFYHPNGVAVVARSQDFLPDLIFISDTFNHCIQVLCIDGPSFLLVRKWGSEGSGDGQLDRPLGIAVDLIADRVYIADTNNHRISVFTIGGLFVQSFGSQGKGDGQFELPQDVAVLPGSLDQDDAIVFVTDNENHRVCVFRSNGSFIRSFGSKGTNAGQLYWPHGIEVHPTQRHVFVADSANHRVQVFEFDGSFVCSIGNSEDCRFPLSVTLDTFMDELYVAESNGVSVFSV